MWTEQEFRVPQNGPHYPIVVHHRIFHLTCQHYQLKWFMTWNFRVCVCLAGCVPLHLCWVAEAMNSSA